MEGGYHGHDGMRRWWEGMHDAFPDFGVEVGEVRDLGDVTLAEVRGSGRGAASDTPVEQRSWHVTEWRDRKLVRWSGLQRPQQALEAVGLSE